MNGTDVQPGVTVASRLRPAYDYPGIDLGSFIGHAELSEAAGYDDNVTGTPSATGSSFLETRGMLDVRSRWVDDTLRAAVSVDDSTYFDQPRQSFTNWAATLSGSHEIGRDVVYAGFTHLNLNQTPRNLDVPQLDRPIAYRADVGQVSYTALFGRLSIKPGVTVTGYGFDNGTVRGVDYIQDYRDRVVVTPSVTTSYEFAPLRSAVLVLSDSSAAYSNRPAGQPSRDYNDFSILAGLNYDTGGKVRFRALAGFEQRTFSSPQYNTISAPILEASAIWNPTGLTTVTALASRTIEDSSSEATAATTETLLKLVVDHELRRNVLLQASGEYVIDSYGSSGSASTTSQSGVSGQSYYTLGAGATWLLNRHMRLAAEYRFARRDSGGAPAFAAGLGAAGGAFGPQGDGSPTFGGSYSENIITLQLRIGL